MLVYNFCFPGTINREKEVESRHICLPQGEVISPAYYILYYYTILLEESSFYTIILNVACRCSYICCTMQIMPSFAYLNKMIASEMLHQFLMLQRYKWCLIWSCHNKVYEHIVLGNKIINTIKIVIIVDSRYFWWYWKMPFSSSSILELYPSYSVH